MQRFTSSCCDAWEQSGIISFNMKVPLKLLLLLQTRTNGAFRVSLSNRKTLTLLGWGGHKTRRWSDHMTSDRLVLKVPLWSGLSLCGGLDETVMIEHWLDLTPGDQRVKVRGCEGSRVKFFLSVLRSEIRYQVFGDKDQDWAVRTWPRTLGTSPSPGPGLTRTSSSEDLRP